MSGINGFRIKASLGAAFAAVALCAGAVDLLPVGRVGWSEPLVVAIKAGQTSSATSFTAADTIYVSWGCQATGGAVTTPFQTVLYVDGVAVKRWSTASLRENGLVYAADVSLGKLTVGQHTLRVTVDDLKKVSETNEGNNSRSKTITVRQVYPFTANTTYRGCVLLGTVIKGYAELKSGKLDKSGRCKLSGFVRLNDGKKISAKAIKVTPNGRELTTTLELKGVGQWRVTVGGGSFAGSFGAYQTRVATIGGALTSANPRARLQSAPKTINNAPVYPALLPISEPVLLRNGKWAFNKAPKIVYASGNATPATPNGNNSKLKLTYTAKTGVFKGSFNVYSNAGKLVKTKATVRGIVVQGKGYADVTFAKSNVTSRMLIY